MTPAASLNLIGAGGYLLAALLLLLLGLLMLTTWRGRMQGGMLLTAILISALWAAAFASQALWQVLPIQAIWVLEGLRDLAWLLFLLQLLGQLPGHDGAGLRLLRWAVMAGALALMLPLEMASGWLAGVLDMAFVDLRLLLLVLLAVCALFLIEQLYRGTPWQHRWGIKFLCLGLGAMFVFDFFFFADALLFGRLDYALWLTRGPINVLVVPLLAVSVARNPQWSFDLTVSRTVVFHSTALAAAGIYLLFMALAGYYIRDVGGEWSALFQPLFLFGAGLLLVVLLFSGNLRTRLKLFVSRHFFSYRYDYRTEWLHLIGVLSGKSLEATLPERVIFALGELVESPGGCIWLRDDDDICRFRRCWNLPEGQVDRTFASAAFCTTLAGTDGVIDIDRGVLGSERAPPIAIPPWMLAQERLWLIVPLLHEDRLQGFVLLAKPRAPHPLGWENIELLRTAARQAASYLALEETARALAEAEQFRGFNRLSAFVVHDLKNLVAQLSLVSRNAERHRANPQFVEDALQTVGHAVDKMNRLLVQLRTAVPTTRADTVALRPLLARLVQEQQTRLPAPQLDVDEARTDAEQAVQQVLDQDPATDADADLVASGGQAGLAATATPRPTLDLLEPMVSADPDRLAAVLANVIQNAQEATPRDGSVTVRLSDADGWAVVEVADTGSGMDEQFIRERLFRPFDSTKGLAGMGIGAYECREFVQLLGGRVEVQSRPGLGTRFRVFLPRCDVMAPEAPEESIAPPSAARMPPGRAPA